MKLRPVPPPKPKEQVILKAQFPEAYFELTQACRYKVFHGGRGGAKSWNFARVLLLLGYKSKLRILCTREYQTSIKDSVHRLLQDQISALGLDAFYKVTNNTIVGDNGTEFIFEGLHHNVSKIKSMEGIDIVWVEEAEKVSDDSWQTLIPTMRKKGSEIWVSFNPDDELDPTYVRFVTNAEPSWLVVQVGWEDNPWFPEELEAERLYLKRVDPDAYEHVWNGRCRKHSKAAVLHGKWCIRTFDPQPHWEGPYYGADWGYSQDPTVLVKCWVDGTRLYIEREAYGVGVELDDTVELFKRIPGSLDHVIRGDNARPETISHLKRGGINRDPVPRLVPVMKWPGSVEDGIKVLRSFEEIVIHDRCKHSIEEARLWSWKVDKLSGDVLHTLVDKHNHCWDAVRYALQQIIRRGSLDYSKLATM